MASVRACLKSYIAAIVAGVAVFCLTSPVNGANQGIPGERSVGTIGISVHVPTNIRAIPAREIAPTTLGLIEHNEHFLCLELTDSIKGALLTFSNQDNQSQLITIASWSANTDRSKNEHRMCGTSFPLKLPGDINSQGRAVTVIVSPE